MNLPAKLLHSLAAAVASAGLVGCAADAPDAPPPAPNTQTPTEPRAAGPHPSGLPEAPEPRTACGPDGDDAPTVNGQPVPNKPGVLRDPCPACGRG